MAADLTRDDLARLRALMDTYFDAERACNEDPCDATYNRCNDAEGAALDGLMREAPALLALASEALDRREGLVFGPESEGCRYAVATDGVPYMLIRLDNGACLLSVKWAGHALTNEFATESEAIEAARAHDRARKKVEATIEKHRPKKTHAEAEAANWLLDDVRADVLAALGGK